MTRNPTIAALITGAALVGASACSSDDSTPATAAESTTTAAVTTTTAEATPAVDYCALLPVAEIRRITGLATTTEPDPPDACHFREVNDTRHTVTVQQAKTVGAAPCYGQPGAGPVAGLGDAACTYITDGAGFTGAVVRIGTSDWTVGISYPTEPENEASRFTPELATELAEVLVANLQ